MKMGGGRGERGAGCTLLLFQYRDITFPYTIKQGCFPIMSL